MHVNIIPYLRLMRLHRPIGILLLLWPTLWALWIAAGGIPPWSILLVFIAGVVVMRSAGCIINDYADRGLDSHVERTKDRPLVTGAANPRMALVFFVVLCLIACGLVWRLNRLALELACIGLVLACVYPFAKRFFAMPQLVLGLTFAWGIPLAFAAIVNSVPWLAWLLFLATFFWIVAYDTEYALADRDDDVKIGIKSTAIFFGRFDWLWVAVLQFLMLLCLCFVGLQLHLSWCYYAALVAAMACFVYQQRLIDSRSRTACLQAFSTNNWVGLSIFIGIFAAYSSMG